MLQETKCDNALKFNLSNFYIIRNDDIRGRCGTAICISKNLRFRDAVCYNDIFQSISCKIKTDSGWHTISSCYFPPRSGVDINTFKRFFDTHKNRLLFGDFNARHISYGDVSSNLYGELLGEMLNCYNLKIFNPPTPTCYASVNGSFIDKIISANSGLHFNTIKLLPSFSDHAGLCVNVGGNAEIVRHPIRFAYDRINDVGFNKYIGAQIQKIYVPIDANLSADGIDAVLGKFNSIIESGIKRFVPARKLDSNILFKLSPQTRALQELCKNLQRKLFRNNNMQFFTKNVIVNKIRLLKIMIRNSCNADTAAAFSEIYDRVEDTREVFSVVKRYTSHKKVEAMGGTLFSDDTKNHFYTGVEDISNAIGENFQINHNLTNNFDSIHSEIVNRDNRLLENTNTIITFGGNITPKIECQDHLRDTNRLLPEFAQNLLTSPEEVEEIIHNRPNKKSVGFDGLPFTVIKTFSPCVILFLCMLFNHMIASAHFPSSWKRALVVAIPKPGKDAGVITNWRPISQLSCISKIFEKLLNKRLINSLTRLPIFKNQFGFLAGHSTEHALCRIQNNINNGLNHQKITSMVALDLKAAFDVVWHGAVIHKMLKIGINPIICKLIKSFLSGRTFAVRLGAHTTDDFAMASGTPQGSVLSPTVFNLYVHDIPIDRHISLTQFADDISLHYTHKKPGVAQNYFNVYLAGLTNYFREWKLKLSEAKSEFINIMGRVADTNIKLRKKARQMNISVNGCILKLVKNVRLLGIQFQEDNRFTKNVNIRLTKARKAFFSLKRLLTNRSIDKNIKTNIYKIYIRPILTYGAPVSNKIQISKLWT